MSSKLEDEIDCFSNILSNPEWKDSQIYNILTANTASNFWAYQNNYFNGHIDRLIIIYETVIKTIGEKNFKYLTRKFLIKFPPDSENMDDFGELFEKYLLNCSEVKNIFFLPYLAKIDWFVYNQLPKKESLTLPKGSFSLWEAIKYNLEINNIQISEYKTECIFIE